ncbi:hypothetical protein BDB00DRAFT_856888 [Zychaea mexicana]|uniref:uncharacterized protein n=1 Tax=Zychaea mexicana TaxID=64656 RepID=UPI0022FE6AA4|nr:uncharacterized protein BDB00DRAFT_856888 [Zychaea mexicana]KAI9482626.1 hypothetical protein BDB00DRAFT_856888 [Zychaea mexicana]
MLVVPDESNFINQYLNELSSRSVRFGQDYTSRQLPKPLKIKRSPLTPSQPTTTGMNMKEGGEVRRPGDERREREKREYEEGRCEVGGERHRDRENKFKVVGVNQGQILIFQGVGRGFSFRCF